jgi:Aspartyl protease/Domain of unknown function (DUF4124)
MHPWRWYSMWLIITALMFSFCSLGYSGGYYTWTDESGNIHVSDSLGSVPEKYRDQIKRKTYEGEKPTPAETPDGTPPQQSPRADEKGEEQQPNRYESPYVPYGGSAKRVIIKAVFNGSVTARLAIDTGAPGTVISSSLAEKIGLFDEGQGRLLIRAGGIGGSAPAVRSIIDTIQVGGAKIEFVPTTIIAPISDAFDGLLGLDFVSNYSVTIDSKRKVVVFEELPKDPDHPGGHDREWWISLFKEFAASRATWKAYSEALDKKIRNSMRSIENEDTARKAFADDQYREAEKLFDKLNQYARENSVPMHWKQY